MTNHATYKKKKSRFLVHIQTINFTKITVSYILNGIGGPAVRLVLDE